jgi:hypothetical protein
MSNSSRLLALTGVLLFSLCTALEARPAYADPSGRVARLSDTEGDVSYSPAGEDDWISAVRNRPLIRGDRLWTERRARAELQVGSAAVRLGPETSFEILELNDRIAQVEVTQGTINLRVRRVYSGQIYEVATPTLAFTISGAGRYRIDVDPRDNVTTIVVWDGAGEAYGDNSHFPLRAGDTVRFYGSDLRDHELYGLPGADDFDRYCLDRDQRLDRSGSLRYVGDDVVGYADLDDYGSWRSVPRYGNVWFPSRVDADWAPYRDGHWVWQEPWGWTWVDDAPWGFAPSHYGRWVNTSNRWGWIPGPRNLRPIYAPALVAFVGGRGWSVSLSLGGSSPIGWFPLGPREVYVPSYQASHDYFNRVNVNNTVINNTIVTNVYNNYSSGNINVTQVNYANRAVPGAVTAVPGDVFVNAQPVRQAAIRLDRNAAAGGEITRVAAIAPGARSVLGMGSTTAARPSRGALDRPVVARSVPPPREAPFAERAPQLQRNPGRAPEPRAAGSAQGQPVNAPPNVRVLAEQPRAVNAREAGSARAGGKPAERADRSRQLQPLDRSAPVQVEQAKRAEQTQREAQAAAQQQAEQGKRAEQAKREAEAAAQQQAEQSKRAEQAKREAQAAAQQQAEQGKRAEQAKREAQAAAQQQAEQGKRAEQAKREAEAAAQQQAEQSKRAEQAKREAQAAAQQQSKRQQRQVRRECEGLSPEDTAKCMTKEEAKDKTPDPKSNPSDR